jgi:hypothetical protein
MALPATNDATAPRASRTYEVQRFSFGRWTVDTLSDDKDVAIELAKSIMSGRRPPSGVRVMAVELRDDGKFSEISVYRSTMIDQARSEPLPGKPKAASDPKAHNETRDFKYGSRGPEEVKTKAGFKNLLRTLQLAFGLAATLAALQALHLLMR